MRNRLGPLGRAMLFALASCEHALPMPPSAPPTPNAFVAVPYPPPEVRVETLPLRPAADAVWVDGHWYWDGRDWVWNAGAWVQPERGARYAAWALRLRPDGSLEYAPASWHDAAGHATPTPRVLARAKGAEPADGTTCH